MTESSLRSAQAKWQQRGRISCEIGAALVVIVDHNGVGSILVFEKVGGELRRCHETPCGFLPIRDAPV